MKKKIVVSILGGLIVFLLAALVLFDLNKKEDKNKQTTQITLAEVTHSIFYAPQYVAIEKGYFEEYGINVELILTPGADKVTAAVLSKDADIGFCGSEGTIYVYNGGEKDYLKSFAQLTQKDGSFLVARKDYKNFTLENLKGKTIIGGRKAGMPAMILEYALQENGVGKESGINIDTSIDFASMSSAFIGGTGDFVTLFEPNALEIEKQGYGHVVASVGELGGIVPYTSYAARKSYINENKKLITNFTKAIQKGLDYVHNHSDEEVAKAIINQFPDTSLEDITKVVKRYHDINAWPKTTELSEKSFNHLQDIMIGNKVLDKKVPYEDLVYNEK